MTKAVEFSTWLAGELHARAWSMRELARRTGYSVTSVSRAISGERGPSRNFCAALARSLRCSEAEVLWRAGFSDERPPALDQLAPDLVELLAIAGRLSVEKTGYLVAFARLMAGEEALQR